MTVIRDLSMAAVARMTPVDLANASGPPDSTIEPFEFHGCDCGVASFKGQPPWELRRRRTDLRSRWRRPAHRARRRPTA